MEIPMESLSELFRPGRITPIFSTLELNQMGFKIMLCTNTVLRSTIKAVGQVMAALK